MATGLMKMSIDELKMQDGSPWAIVGGSPPKSPTVAVCIPFSRKQEPAWSIAMMMMMSSFPVNTNGVICSLSGIRRDVARNSLVKQAITWNSRNVLFIDDDTEPPPDTVHKLLEAMDSADDDVAVVAGIYTTKTDPAQPLVFQGVGMGPYWRWKIGEVFPCKYIATGCMMIRTEVFKHLPEPWFKDIETVEEANQYGLLEDGRRPIAAQWTDDMFFCKRLNDAGYKLLAHGGVLPTHWGEDGRPYRLALDTYPYRGVHP